MLAAIFNFGKAIVRKGMQWLNQKLQQWSRPTDGTAAERDEAARQDWCEVAATLPARRATVLDESGNIYLSVNQHNASVGKDGKKRWDWTFPCLIDSTPAVAANGSIYFSAPWRDLEADGQDGKQQWRLNTDNNTSAGNIVASPTIGNGGTIYAANSEFLCAINSSTPLAPLAKSSWPMFRANPRHTGRVQSGN